MNAYSRPTSAQIAAKHHAIQVDLTAGPNIGHCQALREALKSIPAADAGAALYEALIGLHGFEAAGAIIRAADRALWRDLRP